MAETRRLWCWSCEEMVDAVRNQRKSPGFKFDCPGCGGGVRVSATKPEGRLPRSQPYVPPPTDEENWAYRDYD